MVPIENLRVNKIMNGFWLIRSEKKVLFQKRGSMLAAFGRNRYFDALGGVLNLWFSVKKMAWYVALEKTPGII